MKTAILTGLLLAVTVVGRDTPAKPPNILFCILDDVSYQHMSANGCAWVRTPGFDRVAREGVRFTRAYTPNAKCAPSRASILTGRNSWQLEAAGNHGGYYPAGYRTFMEALGQNGYAVGYTGKGWIPGDPGLIGGKPRELTGKAFNARKLAPPTTGIYPTDYVANLQDFLAQKPADRPFCFWLGGWEPHRPYEYGTGVRLGGKSTADIDRVPAFWPDDGIVRNDMLDYAYELEYIDRQIVRMLEVLKAAGELENTVVVITSDNGMPFPRAKGAAYELSLHLPLAIMWPAGIAQPGRNVDGYVSFIDLAPTFLELAGLDWRAAGMEQPQGRSLLSVLREQSQAPAAPDRAYLLLGQERHDVGRPDDTGYPVRGMLKDDFLYLHNFEPTRWPMGDPITGYLNTDGGPTKTRLLTQNREGVNHGLWVLNFGRHQADELYDLKRDPDCMINLAAEKAHASRLAAMRGQLFAELRAQRDPRMAGEGSVFDRYPYADGKVRNFYNRWVHDGERIQPGWVEPGDFETPGFDPETPLRSANPAKP